MSRACGDCTVCCTLTFVPELNKVEGVTCINCDNGCSIYENRPTSCRGFSCAWLSGNIPEELRPDKVGVMIEEYPEMVAALLVKDKKISDFSPTLLSTINEYVEMGLPVIATGQFARLPDGMTPEEAKSRLVRTVKGVRA
jgi:hypothetical protein